MASGIKSEKPTSRRVRAPRVTKKKPPVKNSPVDKNTRLSKRLSNKSSDVSVEQPEGKNKRLAEKKKSNVRKSKRKVKEEGQASLEVSFLNQAKSQRLRPRRIVKNYHEDTTITDKESSTVDKVDKPKVPIYKSIPLNDDPVNNESEVYEFKYDEADVRQVKKKKKRAKQTVVQKLMKVRAKLKLKQEQKLKQEEQKQKYQPVVILERQDVKDIQRFVNPSNIVSEPDTMTEGLLEDVPDIPNDRVPSEILTVENDQMQEETQQGITPPTKNIKRRKPIITSIENLTDKKVKVMNNPVSLAKDTFTSLKPNLTINNCSLLEKSISPIVKTAETFDFGSPWRAPPLLAFSRIRNLYQSTPRNNKMKVLAGKLPRVPTDPKNCLNLVKEKEAIHKAGDKADTENSLVLSNQKKKSTSGRKFGTEITNIDHSAQVEYSLTDVSVQRVNDKVDAENSSTVSNQKKKSTSGRKFGTEIANIDHSAHTEHSLTDVSAKFRAESEILEHSIGTDKNDMQNTQRLDFEDDKENNAISNNETTMLNCLTPKKNLQRKNKKLPVHNLLREGQGTVNTIERKKPNFELERAGSRKSSTTNEYFNPIPGPSGLQKKQEFDENVQSRMNKSNSFDEERNEGRVLRQSNLNNFLNLVDMPETTTIKTSHGIFDDIHSPPVSHKSVAKHEEICSDPKVDLKNAFGFAEIDASPRLNRDCDKENDANRIVKTGRRNTVAPARLSVREITNYLTPPISKDSQNRNKEESKIPHDIASFSDTFDILSDAGELSTDKAEIPLFTDPEPSHFIEPPKHSYKRKRQVRFSFSEDSDEADEKRVEVMAKRRRKKLSSKDEKRLEAWIKDVNRTFEEIDQYDLVVE